MAGREFNFNGDFDRDGLATMSESSPSMSMAPPLASSRPWSSAGGLSIQMELPKNAKTLSFSKVGGNPALTLNVQAAETNRWLWGLGWCVVSLIVGLWILKAFRKAETNRAFIRVLANLAIIIGLVGFFFLPTALGWPFFWVFCLGGFTRVVLAQPKAAVSALS